MADPDWLWADSIVLNFNRVHAYKEVNTCQWSEARLCSNELYESLVGHGVYQPDSEKCFTAHSF